MIGPGYGGKVILSRVGNGFLGRLNCVGQFGATMPPGLGRVTSRMARRLRDGGMGIPPARVPLLLLLASGRR